MCSKATITTFPVSGSDRVYRFMTEKSSKPRDAGANADHKALGMDWGP
jgi:hypothetical protein